MSDDHSDALRAALSRFLRCPVCGGALGWGGRGLDCSLGHHFDVARQGYVNLGAGLGRVPLGADTAAAVAARGEFLTAGHFAPLVAELTAAATRWWPGGAVLDAGAGPGHYLAAVLDALPEACGLALDSSPAALRRAAVVHPRAAAVGWDLREPWPVHDGVAGLVLNVFAPRNAAEFARVLRPDGHLLVVVPGPEHLRELVDGLGLIGVDADKPARLAATLDGGFVLVDERLVAHRLSLSRNAVQAVVAMGPNAAHLRGTELADRVARLPELTEVAARVWVRTYRPRRSALS